MIVKMQIRDERTQEEAILQYDGDPSQRTVTWGLIDGSVELASKLDRYFHKESTFKMPTDPETDEFEIQNGVPIKSLTFFELSLSKMFFNIRVKLLKDVSNV